MTIAVQKDGRVLIDQIQRGVQYSSTSLANSQAAKLHVQYPHAKLILADTKA